MVKVFLFVIGLSGLFATALGAYGAHGLPGRVSDSLLATYNTAVLYQFLHTLALMGVALWLQRAQSRLLVLSGCFFVVGMMLFSGSIYALVFLGSIGLSFITPLGGLILMFGWLSIVLAAWLSRVDEPFHRL